VQNYIAYMFYLYAFFTLQDQFAMATFFGWAPHSSNSTELQGTTDQLQASIAQLKTAIGTLQETKTAMQQQVDSNLKEINCLTAKFDNLTMQVETLNSSLSSLQKTVHSTFKNNVSLDDLSTAGLSAINSSKRFASPYIDQVKSIWEKTQNKLFFITLFFLILCYIKINHQLYTIGKDDPNGWYIWYKDHQSYTEKDLLVEIQRRYLNNENPLDKNALFHTFFIIIQQEIDSLKSYKALRGRIESISYVQYLIFTIILLGDWWTHNVIFRMISISEWFYKNLSQEEIVEALTALEKIKNDVSFWLTQQRLRGHGCSTERLI
jgi:hypothetical protein